MLEISALVCSTLAPGNADGGADMTKRRGRGEGEIRLRPDGRWEARLRVDSPNGTQVRRSIYGSTRAAVAHELRGLQQAADQGHALTDARTTVGSFLNRWLVEVVQPAREFATWRGYETNIRLHIIPTIGSIPLVRLQPVDVQRMINQLQGNGLAPRTVQYAHATLRAALGVALRWGLVSRNVATLIEPVSVPLREVEPFSPDEVRRVLDAAATHRLAAFFTAAMAIGLRPSEALALTWTDVDLDARVLRVRRALERTPDGYAFKEPKSRTSRRTIALPQVCVESLTAHRRRQAAERLAAGMGWLPLDLVFSTGSGGPLSRTEMSRQFTKLLVAARVPHRRLYDCRHTAATLLLAQGVAPRVVMETLGHSSFSLTMDTYTHVLPSLLRDAADAIDRALDDRQEPGTRNA
jgi:integrase